MAFESQIKKSRESGRRVSGSDVVISQSYKPSTRSEELSVRISVKFMGKIGLEIGSMADVLFDSESKLWMVKKTEDEGFKVSGKEGGPTGLIRYTLKDGHARLTEERSDLPVKRSLNMESLNVDESNSNFTFSLRDL